MYLHYYQIMICQQNDISLYSSLIFILKLLFKKKNSHAKMHQIFFSVFSLENHNDQRILKEKKLKCVLNQCYRAIKFRSQKLSGSTVYLNITLNKTNFK